MGCTMCTFHVISTNGCNIIIYVGRRPIINDSVKIPANVIVCFLNYKVRLLRGLTKAEYVKRRRRHCKFHHDVVYRNATNYTTVYDKFRQTYPLLTHVRLQQISIKCYIAHYF